MNENAGMEEVMPNRNERDDGNTMVNGKEIESVLVLLFLAMEVWADVLGFIPRIQLARTVSLTNRRIHQLCWPRLHGNKVMAHDVLEEIMIGRRDELGQSPMTVLLKDGNEVPIPDCPMPNYITGFSRILIDYLDEQVLAFFKHVSHCIAPNPNPIYIELLMGSSKKMEQQRAYLNQLLQILREAAANIRHLDCQLANIQYLQHVDSQTGRLQLDGYEDSDIPHLMKMLASPRPDGRQRVIALSLTENLTKKMVEAIKKEFRECTQAMPQPFYLHFHGVYLDIPISEELNPQTGETLMIVHNDGNWNLGIYRHPTGQHAQWAEDARERIEWAEQVKTYIHVDTHDFCDF